MAIALWRLDSDYMLSENSPLFFMYRTLYTFLEVHGPSSSEFINFLSTTHLLIARTPRVLDYMLKRSQTSVIWGSSLTALCAKQSCIHFSFAFTPLDNVTFRLEQYVFKNWPLKLCRCAYQHQPSTLSLLGTLLHYLLLVATKTSLRAVNRRIRWLQFFSLMATPW